MKVYRLTIDPNTDSLVYAIADVDKPAIESDFIAFGEQQRDITFSADEEKMELIGAAMIPDKMIFRKGTEGQEDYYVYFTKEDIRLIAQEFFRNGFQKEVNLDHSVVKSNSFIYQSYIVDESKGIASPKGLNLPDGTWVIGKKIEDADEWSDIKSGRRNGFSVEGMFKMLPAKFEATPVNKEHERADEELYEALVQLNQLLSKIK